MSAQRNNGTQYAIIYISKLYVASYDVDYFEVETSRAKSERPSATTNTNWFPFSDQGSGQIMLAARNSSKRLALKRVK